MEKKLLSPQLNEFLAHEIAAHETDESLGIRVKDLAGFDTGEKPYVDALREHESMSSSALQERHTEYRNFFQAALASVNALNPEDVTDMRRVALGAVVREQYEHQKPPEYEASKMGPKETKRWELTKGRAKLVGDIAAIDLELEKLGVKAAASEEEETAAPIKNKADALKHGETLINRSLKVLASLVKYVTDLDGVVAEYLGYRKSKKGKIEALGEFAAGMHNALSGIEELARFSRGRGAKHTKLLAELKNLARVAGTKVHVVSAKETAYVSLKPSEVRGLGKGHKEAPDLYGAFVESISVAMRYTFNSTKKGSLRRLSAKRLVKATKVLVPIAFPPYKVEDMVKAAGVDIASTSETSKLDPKEARREIKKANKELKKLQAKKGKTNFDRKMVKVLKNHIKSWGGEVSAADVDSGSDFEDAVLNDSFSVRLGPKHKKSVGAKIVSLFSKEQGNVEIGSILDTYGEGFSRFSFIFDGPDSLDALETSGHLLSDKLEDLENEVHNPYDFKKKLASAFKAARIQVKASVNEFEAK